MIPFTITLTGTAPLIMHSARSVNPLEPLVKEISKINAKKTNKTDEDKAEVGHLEYLLGLYHDPDIGPYLPAQNIAKAIVDGARMSRKGKDIERGLLLHTDAVLAYKGPRDPEQLWANENFRLITSVVIARSRVMRARPMFREWTAQTTGQIDPEVINFTDFCDYATTAGQLVGIGDWRPRYGRFTAQVERIAA